jgi:hypothetical protein
MTRSIVASFRATSASRHAAHSTVEPRASSKNLARCFPWRLPLPSAVLSSEERLARSSWIANLAIQTLSSRADLRQENRRPCDKGQLHLINIELLVVEDGLVIHCLTLSVSDDEDEHEGRGEPDPSRLAQTCGIGIGPKNIRSTFSLPITRTSSCIVQYITISTSRMIWIAQKCGHTISASSF